MNIQIVSGSVPGSDHTLPGKPSWKNNQDASFVKNTPNCTIGIVADGCGSGNQSEVGSNLGVRIFGEALFRGIMESGKDGEVPTKMRPENLERARMRMLSSISILSDALGGPLSETIETFFLFSIVGFVILSEKTYVFACGDGSYVINGEEIKLGPFPGNEPPYPCYALLGKKESSKFCVTEYDTALISDIAVATDGVEYFPDTFAVKYKKIIEDGRIFMNRDVLRRGLAILNQERIDGGILVPGPLKDDTTMVIARKF